jgi:hypothetical protein
MDFRATAACKAVGVLVVVALIAVWLNYKIHRIPIPKEEKLADCTSDTLSFLMTVRHHRPYSIVLGMPRTSTNQLSFRGEMQFLQSTQIVATIPISSYDMKPCNWLDEPPGAGLAGYILTWGRTNRTERQSEILTKGQSYHVEVKFSQPPPKDSSLWLSSVAKVGER